MMQKEDQHPGEHEVVVTSAMAAERSRTVKHGNTFAVFDGYGDIRLPPMGGDQGIFHNGTRFVSHYEFLIEGRRPLLLSSDITHDNHLITVDLTNPDLRTDAGMAIGRGDIHVFRSKFLWQGRCYEKFRIKNYGLTPLAFKLQIRFSCDFADIFEVRGMRRERRGTVATGQCSASAVEIPYRGRDGLPRRTRFDFTHAPDRLSQEQAVFALRLNVGEEFFFEVVASCLMDTAPTRVSASSYQEAYDDSAATLRKNKGSECEIITSKESVNILLERATSDLRMLLTRENDCLYPYAGIPWFCTPFGRDGLITALETVWCHPEISRGVLCYLADHQATQVNASQDAEPGKILHEVRMGEMTNTGELPFAHYYGSADATPLFIVLAGHYLQRTGNLDFIRSIWPNIERALQWIAQYGDCDGDGFVEYARKAEHGIVNQAWKDANDSVFHADGSLAQAPIAICEVQGYVYAAKVQAAEMTERLGIRDAAVRLRQEASDLKKKFNQVFWDPELPGFVLGLDKDKRPCRVQASNMGHCLFSAIASRPHARIVADQLMTPSFFSGWGIRTLAQGQPRYNPMSYHNGSIWPHDNAIIAQGLANYGFKSEAAAVMTAMFQMSHYTELNRFPELFCGFRRRPNQGPTLYPVACSPQAWSAASIFALLQACLGISINAFSRRVHFHQPYLPPELNAVTVRNLPVAEGVLDFTAVRHAEDVGIHVIKRLGEISISINK